MNVKCSWLNAHLCYDCNDLILYEYVRVRIPHVVGVAHRLSWSDTIVFFYFLLASNLLGLSGERLTGPDVLLDLSVIFVC